MVGKLKLNFRTKITVGMAVWKSLHSNHTIALVHNLRETSLLYIYKRLILSGYYIGISIVSFLL